LKIYFFLRRKKEVPCLRGRIPRQHLILATKIFAESRGELLMALEEKDRGKRLSQIVKEKVRKPIH